MLIHRIKLENLLSFGPKSPEIELGPLNVLIGPNGSGKSNLIEAISLLHAAPMDLTSPIRDGGGVHDWLWKGEPKTTGARIEVVINYPKGLQPLRYQFTFAEKGQRFELTDERIEYERPDTGHEEPYFFFKYQNGRPYLNVKETGHRQLFREDINPEQSILAQRKDPDHYPELTYLGQVFSQIKLYREWSFGRYTPARLPQKVDLPNNLLEENASNLGLVLNRLRGEPKVKKQLQESLFKLYEGVSDVDLMIEGGTVQVFSQEGNITVPATRLSEGTLRYLCLLAILCHPKPPPLVCIEEPELGLHPDIMPTLVDLLRDASSRCQLIVTTHSEALVEALTDMPESVIVCEKHQGQSVLRRLDRNELSDWLEHYSLGELWRKGELGGTRW